MPGARRARTVAAMPTTTSRRVNGVRLHHETHGAGAPICTVHATGGSAAFWDDAVLELRQLGRVIAYDRRGCGRSERPDPYERTSVREHAGDLAALLDALDAAPAVVIGRSYGATVAADLALRRPDRVRALVLLEGDAPRALAPAAARWVDALGDRLRELAARAGVDAVGEALVTAAVGAGAWRALPEELRRIVTGNGPAILAELAGEWWLEADAEALAGIEQPALLVAAEGSPPEFREATDALAAALPNARTVPVGGDHLIDPAHPAVLAFVAEVLGR